MKEYINKMAKLTGGSELGAMSAGIKINTVEWSGVHFLLMKQLISNTQMDVITTSMG